MNIGIVYFTEKGQNICNKICDELAKNREININVRDKKTPLKEWTKQGFLEFQCILFISATGIATRSIAPFIKSKTEDPAVIVVDDMGKFAISLLSGHVGGANKLTETISQIIGAIPVITTATDVNEKLAIDSWAVENKLIIDDIKPAKDIAMDILKDKDVFVTSDVELNIKEKNIYLKDAKSLTKEEKKLGINISYMKDKIFEKELKLIPKSIVLGIGCRRGKSSIEIESFVREELEKLNIDLRSICKICSIDLKKDETGLIEFANKLGVDFKTYSAKELENAKGEFPKSNFVSGITGVDNVCQRSAKIGSEDGEILLEKTSKNGITLSVGKKNIKLVMKR